MDYMNCSDWHCTDVTKARKRRRTDSNFDHFSSHKLLLLTETRGLALLIVEKEPSMVERVFAEGESRKHLWHHHPCAAVGKIS